MPLNLLKNGVEHREDLHVPVVVDGGFPVGFQMEGVDHVHVVQIGGGGLVGQVHRVLQGQVPDGEGFKFGVARFDAPLVVVVELGEAGGHLPAAGAGSRHHHKGAAGFNIVVFPQPLVADDVGHVGGVAGNGIVPVAADSQMFQPVEEGVRRSLPAVAGQHHAAYIQSHVPEDVNEPEDILVVGDAQIPPDFVFFNVPGIDGNDDFHVVLQLLKHPDLAVRRKARQHPGSVIIVKQLAAEFQIQLAAELMDPLFDLFGLGGEIFLIVKADGSHGERPFIPVLECQIEVYHRKPGMERFRRGKKEKISGDADSRFCLRLGGFMVG